MEETEQERRRRAARERKRRERARRSPSKVEAARAADAQRRRLTLLHETEYEREIRRSRERVRQRIKRQLATPEEIEERRKREREATAERRKWTPEEKEEKRRRDRELNAQKRFTRQQNKAGPSNLDVDPAKDSQKISATTVSSENVLQKKNQFKRRRRAATKSKPGENHESQLKKMVVPNHQHFVMSNLCSLWKNRKLCDAGIGNGKSTIRVHKVVLSAVCPKLLSVFSTDILSQKFLQVNFPEEVSKEALNAFAEYMYNGILDLDHDILKQLQIIAKRLDMKEFEELCDKYLPKNLPQPTDTSVSTPIPTMTTSSASAVSAPIKSAPSITPQVIEVKPKISATERAQVEKDTAAAFGQKSNVTLLDPKKADCICPNTETGPANDKYGHLSSSSSNQVFTPTTSPSSSTVATAASTSILSIPASSTEFSIPFSQSTDGKSTKLKPTHSYETPLVSDLSPVSRIGETVYSQYSPMSVDSSKQLSRQSITTSSIQLPSTRPVMSVAQTFDPNS